MSVPPLAIELPSVREVSLETPRLILREHRPDDTDAVLAYAADPEVLRYREAAPATREQVASNLARIDAQRTEPFRRRYELAVVAKADDQLIGWLPLLLGDLSAPGEAEIGWTLARRFWGQGFATEAADAVVTFAFETLRLHRVWARCQAENVASARLMEKLGMRPDEPFRVGQRLKGQWVDVLYYELREQDWWARRREML